MRMSDQSVKTPKSNVPEFSVSELSFSLKRTLEDNFGRVRVRGELSKITIAGSGHMYSSLKDENAVIDAICWKGNMSKLSIKPEEGLEVICVGKVTSYPKGSKYQIIIESMELAGEGALLKMLDDRRKKLAAEGLFDENRKQPLPFLPEVIGVITSPTGAVIRDILHRLYDRFPRHVLLWPVIVQGDGAANQIEAAIEGFQNIEQHGLNRPDILIIARGGGSLEDLMAFNEENVVRAAAASTIPIISAVGHETDTTLIDYAADLRAPTPTGAAEVAVPVRAHLMAQVLDDEKRLVNGVSRLFYELRNRLEAQSRGLGDPAKILEIKSQSLDHISDKIGRVFQHLVSNKSEGLTKQAARLPHPRNILQNANMLLERWSDNLHIIGPRITKNSEQSLLHANKMLEAYSFKNILDRGFVVVRDQNNTVLTDPELVMKTREIKLEFKDNQFVNANTKAQNEKAKPPKKSKTGAKDGNQQNLF